MVLILGNKDSGRRRHRILLWPREGERLGILPLSVFSYLILLFVVVAWYDEGVFGGGPALWGTSKNW